MPILFPLGSSLAYTIWNKCNGNNDLVLLHYHMFLTAEELLRSTGAQALRFDFTQISVNYYILSCLLCFNFL